MTLSVSLFFAVILFFFGVKLSAFFSGSETGFYRVSTLQLTLGKQRGDRVAAKLFYFVTHPERFVATTLVGNNVANYVTTVAIGIVVAAVWPSSSGGPEVLATLMLTPIIFIFGELIPKSLYYRAPMSLLRSGAVGFAICYYVFLPISYPLILISRLVSRLSKSDKRPLEVVFGRTRLYGVFEAGQREGILTGLQRNLAENLMQVADQPVDLSMLPASTVQGVSETATIEEVLSVAQRTDSAHILIHAAGKPTEWISTLRVADMLTTGLSPRLAMKPLPQFSASAPRLEVLTQMIGDYALYGVVKEQSQIVGIIERRTLISQLFRVVRPASSQPHPAHATEPAP